MNVAELRSRNATHRPEAEEVTRLVLLLLPMSTDTKDFTATKPDEDKDSCKECLASSGMRGMVCQVIPVENSEMHSAVWPESSSALDKCSISSIAVSSTECADPSAQRRYRRV